MVASLGRSHPAVCAHVLVGLGVTWLSLLPSFGICRPLAFVAWGSVQLVVLRPASGLCT
jgi:hypothetical protein